MIASPMPSATAITTMVFVVTKDATTEAGGPLCSAVIGPTPVAALGPIHEAAPIVIDLATGEAVADR